MEQKIYDTSTVESEYKAHTFDELTTVLRTWKLLPDKLKVKVGELEIECNQAAVCPSKVKVNGEEFKYVRAIKLEGSVGGEWLCTVEFYPGLAT